MPSGTPGPLLPTSGSRAARRLYPLGGVCAECEVATATDRHHWDGDQLNNAPENVVLLCRRCHMRIDGRRDAVAERGREWQRQRAALQRADRPTRTHCPHGHELTPANTRILVTGKRICRACNAEQSRRWRARR